MDIVAALEEFKGEFSDADRIPVLGADFTQLGVDSHLAKHAGEAHDGVVGVEMDPLDLAFERFALDNETFVLPIHSERHFFLLRVAVDLAPLDFLDLLDLWSIWNIVQSFSSLVQQLLNAFLGQRGDRNDSVFLSVLMSLQLFAESFEVVC